MNEVKIITAVASELLSRDDDVKPELKIDHSDEDTVLDEKIAAARDLIELWCGISIGSQTRQWIADLKAEQEIPFGPVTAVTAAYYKTSDGYEAKTVDTDYEVESDAQFMTFTPLTCGRWKLTYTAGYTAGTLPKGLKQIWLQLVVHLYTNRQDEAMDIPKAIRYALNTYRRSLI